MPLSFIDARIYGEASRLRKHSEVAGLPQTALQPQRCLKVLPGVLLLLLGALGASPPTTSEPAGIQWTSYTRSALKHAVGKPVLVDVGAEWCDICHEMDRTTYRDPRVIELARHFLMVKLDATDPDRPPASAFIDRYRLEGVPSLVVFDAKGQERPDLRRDGYLTAEELLEVMRTLQR